MVKYFCDRCKREIILDKNGVPYMALMSVKDLERKETETMLCNTCFSKLQYFINYPPLVEVGACNYPVVKAAKSLPPF